MGRQKKGLVFEEEKLPTDVKDIVDRFRGKPGSEVTDYLYNSFISATKEEKEAEERNRPPRNITCFYRCLEPEDDDDEEESYSDDENESIEEEEEEDLSNDNEEEEDNTEENELIEEEEGVNNNNDEEDIELADNENNINQEDNDIEDDGIDFLEGDEVFIPGFSLGDMVADDDNDDDNRNFNYANQLYNGGFMHPEDFEANEEMDEGDDDTNFLDEGDPMEAEGDDYEDDMIFNPLDSENINLTDNTDDDEKVRLLNNSKYAGVRESMWLLGMCDPQLYISKVKSIKSPVQVCGKILAPGEHGYKCSTCENDSSCVLCVDCFEPGKHVGHNYRLIQVVGGCCDCGDPCAWNPAGFCSHHNGIDPHEDLLKYFPPEFVDGTRAVVRAMVRAIAQNAMESRANTKANKEIIGALNKLAKLLGYGFGRIVIQELNQKLPGDDNHNSGDDDGKPKHELFGSNLWRLIEYDALYRSFVKKELHSLYITLLADPLFKMSIGRVIAALYRTINHNITAFNSSVDNSVMSLNVQVFTVPSYSTPIIRETNLMENIFAELLDQFKGFEGKDNLYDPMVIFRRRGSHLNMLNDLELILDQTRNAHLFLRSPDLIDNFVRLMAPLQGAFSYVHKKGEHVEMEEKGIGILVYLDQALSHTFSGLISVFHPAKGGARVAPKEINVDMSSSEDSSNADKELDKPLTEKERLDAVRILFKGISDLAKKKLKRCPRRLVEYDSEHSVHIVPYDITSKNVSIFNPISRLVSQLIHGYLETGYNPDELLKVLTPLELFEAPLEIFAFLAQIDAGLWVRNGADVNTIPEIYRTSIEYANIYENFFILQYCAAVVPRDTFIMTFLNRYGLVDNCSAFTKKGQGIEYRPLVLSRALGDLIEIALNVNNLPCIDPRTVARYELINILASKKSRSYKSISAAISKSTRDFMDEVLREIANKTPQTVTTPAKYSLKTEFYSEVDPYNFTTTKKRIGVFEELWSDYVAALNKKKRKKAHKPIYPCLHVRNAPHILFEKLPSILSERPVISLIARAICGEFAEGSDHIESRLLTVCLHVLMLCAEERAVCSLENFESVVLNELTMVREITKKTNGEEGSESDNNNEVKRCSALSVLCGLYTKDKTFWLLEKVLTLLKKNADKDTAAVDMISDAFNNGGDTTSEDEDAKEANRAILKRKSKQESILSKLRKTFSSKIEELERSFDDSELAVPPSKSPHLDDESSNSVSPSITPIGSSNNDIACECDDDDNVCVLCHEGGGSLSWIGYCQQSDLVNAVARVNKDTAFWKGNCKEESELFDAEAEREEDKHKPVYEDSLMYYLKRGLKDGVFIQKCSHMIHESCLQKYIETTSRQAEEDDLYAFEPFDGRKGLFSCPACKRLSNMTIPVSDTVENITFPLTVLFKENGVPDVYEYQDTYLELTRSLAFTLASHEIAERSSEKKGVPTVPPQKESLQKVLFNSIATLFAARDGTDRESIADTLDNLVFKHGSYGNCTLASFEPLNVLILRAVLFKAGMPATDDGTRSSLVKTLCGELLNKVALAELVRVTASLGKTEPSIEIAPYMEAFLRRAVMAVSSVTGTPVEQLCTEVPLFASLSDKKRNAVTFLLAETDAREEFSGWMEALTSTSGMRDRGFSPITASLVSPFHIAPLPKSYTDIVRMGSKAVCPNCKKHPSIPATCIVCGRVVCVRSHCCSDKNTGECNIHAQYCLHGPGVYLNCKLGAIMLIRSDGGWGSLWHSPYVDEHGEEGYGTVSDTPLFLAEDRVRQLEKLILNHEIDDLCSNNTSSPQILQDWTIF